MDKAFQLEYQHEKKQGTGQRYVSFQMILSSMSKMTMHRVCVKLFTFMFRIFIKIISLFHPSYEASI